jgi:hypothetical protein
MRGLPLFFLTAAAASVLGACVSGHFAWNLTQDEGLALRQAPVPSTRSAQVGTWSLQCSNKVMGDENPCSLQVQLALGNAVTIAIWPGRELVAAYGEHLEEAKFVDGQRGSIVPSICFPGVSSADVCVFERQAGRDLLAALRGGQAVVWQSGNDRVTLPDGFANVERTYAGESGYWRDRARMNATGGGGGGGGSGSM